MQAKLTEEERHARRRALNRAAQRRSRERHKATPQDPSASVSLADVQAASAAAQARRYATIVDPKFRAWLKAADEKVKSWNDSARRLGVGGAAG